RGRGHRADPRQVILLEAHGAEEGLQRRKEFRRHPLLRARADLPDHEEDDDRERAAPGGGIGEELPPPSFSPAWKACHASSCTSSLVSSISSLKRFEVITP